MCDHSQRVSSASSKGWIRCSSVSTLDSTGPGKARGSFGPVQGRLPDPGLQASRPPFLGPGTELVLSNRA
eukprot:1262969-Pyramimonas_sp.AAC.1